MGKAGPVLAIRKGSHTRLVAKAQDVAGRWYAYTICIGALTKLVSVFAVDVEVVVARFTFQFGVAAIVDQAVGAEPLFGNPVVAFVIFVTLYWVRVAAICFGTPEVGLT